MAWLQHMQMLEIWPAELKAYETNFMDNFFSSPTILMTWQDKINSWGTVGLTEHMLWDFEPRKQTEKGWRKGEDQGRLTAVVWKDKEV